MSMCEERRVVASFFHGKNHDDASTPHSADFYNKYDPHFLENAGLLQQKVNATPSFVAVLSFPTRYLRC